MSAQIETDNDSYHSGRSAVPRLLAAFAGALLLLAGCGGGTSGRASAAHSQTPSSSTRAAILRAVRTGFFSTTGAPPDLRITRLKEVAEGSTDWARATFAATPHAPPVTQQAVANGHSQGLLRHATRGQWTWIGYLPRGGSCRTVGPSDSDGATRLLGLAPLCAGRTTPGVSPGASPGGVASTTLSSGDEATLLSIFVTAKNSGPSGQVLTPTMIRVSPKSPPRAAVAPGGVEWAIATYMPAPGAPEPLTTMQLQNGGGTAFYSRPPGHSWVLRGLAGHRFCAGAAAAHLPPAVLKVWGHKC